MLDLLTEYFQPRSKVKEEMRVSDLTSDQDLTHHQHQIFKMSNMELLEETQLGAKTLLKTRLKEDLLNELEFEGYVQTVNSLLEDLVELTSSDLPLYVKKLDAEAIIKLLGVDFGLAEDEYDYGFLFNRLTVILPVIERTILTNAKTSPIFVYYYPEHLLSPRQQVMFKEYLLQVSEKMNVLVLSKSRYFLSDELMGNNVIANGKQIITEDFLEELEWRAPVNYSIDQLKQSCTDLLKSYAMNFETFPVISNCKLADIHVFAEADLYVIIELMEEFNFEYALEINYQKLSRPVSKYVQQFERR
ncbi:hypothetical protein SHA02_11790 [Salisediminibacterium halotolerans]|nr:hypothetical protein SHA02_11790 [Salisediminibacterium halotolerans]